MQKIRHWGGSLLLSALAGISIGIGGMVFLSTENPVVGAFLFTIGLMTISVFRWNLFTGRVGYTSYRSLVQVLELLWIWVGNFLGIALSAFALSQTRHAPRLIEKAEALVRIKEADSLWSLFLLAIFCGMLMYIAVEGFRSNPHPAGKYLALFLSVMVFILCGFEHCIANMFYFSLVGITGKSLVCLFVMSIGNLIGGAGCARLMKWGQVLYAASAAAEPKEQTVVAP